MNESYGEIGLVTPRPDMMAALIAASFITQSIPVWIKPLDDKGIKVCFPNDRTIEAMKIFDGIQQLAVKKQSNEKPSGRNGSLHK